MLFFCKKLQYIQSLIPAIVDENLLMEELFLKNVD